MTSAFKLPDVDCSMVLPGPTTEEMAKPFFDHVRKNGFAALGKETHELSNDEKFAVGFYAGVKIVSMMDEVTGKMNFKTEPFGIVKIDGKFHVAVMAHPRS